MDNWTFSWRKMELRDTVANQRGGAKAHKNQRGRGGGEIAFYCSVVPYIPFKAQEHMFLVGMHFTRLRGGARDGRSFVS